MRQVKVIFFSLLSLCIVIILFSFLIPSKTKLSRAITIKKPIDVVKKELNNFKNWEQWHIGITEKNKQNKVTYNVDSSVMTMNNVTMEIIGQNDSSVQYKSSNRKGELIFSTANLINHNDSCTVNWFYQFKARWYPWEKFRSIFIDNMYGPSIDTNLTALKKYLER